VRPGFLGSPDGERCSAEMMPYCGLPALLREAECDGQRLLEVPECLAFVTLLQQALSDVEENVE
jgi:hypothetical protein